MEITKKYSKTTILILAVIIILGVYVRFSNLSGDSYWNDDMTTIPTGLLWFYPHSYYPGLAGQGEPALGNLFIGLGCMASGQDFSKVTQMQPMFYPGRPALIGKEMAAADIYCHFPMYIFGLLFFIAIIILAVLLLDEYSAIYTIGFYAFGSFVLQSSRWIHVDMISYFFAAIGLIFLWKFYVKEIGSKYETLFIALSAFSFGLALSTKLPAGIFSIFLAFILLKKYKAESLSVLKNILQKLNLKISEKISYDAKPNKVIKFAIYSIIAYAFAILISFEFKFKNLFLVLSKYSGVNPEHSFLAFNKQFLLDIYTFLTTLNPIDTLIFMFSIYIIIKLFFTKKDKNEYFLFYLFMLFLITVIFFPAMNYARVFYIFSPAVIFIMALTFSEKQYSVFNVFKINNKKTMFFVFIAIYIILSFSIAVKSSPHFTPKNMLLCPLDHSECASGTPKYFDGPYGLFAKQVANDLNQILNEDETFISSSEVHYYYTRQEESYDLYLFINSVRKQIDRRPNLAEFVKYYKPQNRALRYVVVNPASQDSDFPEFEDLKKNYIPNYLTRAYGLDVAYIYDMNNLSKKT